LDVENSSSTICAHWQPARGLSAVNSNSLHSGNNGLKIYFQNISGMRTKTQSVFMNTSNSDYNIIKLVETWLNSNFSSNEFFDPKLFQVFRKGRDFGRMQCERGGGVIVVSRKSCCTVMRLLNDDSLLDQLAVTVSGSSGKISVVASYVPPGGDSGLYPAYLDNISNIHAVWRTLICVAGDFNLSSIFWTWDPQASAMVPGNVQYSHEIIVIDDCFSMGLTQIKIFSMICISCLI